MTTPNQQDPGAGHAIESVPIDAPPPPQILEPAPQQQQQEPALLTLGALQVTQTHIFTPLGALPLADSNVTFIDQTRQTSKTPTWAIVLTVITVWFFLLGLLFLMAKEVSTSGYVSVTVQHRDGRSYTEHVPVSSAYQRDQVIAQASWIQQAAASATWRNGSS